LAIFLLLDKEEKEVFFALIPLLLFDSPLPLWGWGEKRKEEKRGEKKRAFYFNFFLCFFKESPPP